MNRNNNSHHQQKAHDAEKHFDHVPPEVNRAEVERAKEVEQDVKAPDEPIQQFREGPRRKRRQSKS